VDRDPLGWRNCATLRYVLQVSIWRVICVAVLVGLWACHLLLTTAWES
jgi:hypothetical protein